MIYEKYLYNSKSESIDTESYDYNYFELKYLEEINSLYLKSKRILEHYGLDFFKDKDFMELFNGKSGSVFRIFELNSQFEQLISYLV